MTKIISSRGTGKTTQLLCIAAREFRRGKDVIFVTYSKESANRLQKEYRKIKFCTLAELITTRGQDFSNSVILIDELELCLRYVIPPFAELKGYSLTIGD